jgi:hypothetical protein
MVSRQAYTLGVIFHLTGSAMALERAAAGVRFIVEHAFDPATGSVASFLVDGAAALRQDQRTTQDLAYAMLGPAFYYYLTRDPSVLDYLRAVRAHIFEEYWWPDQAMLRWSNDRENPAEAGRRELVSQLDQINGWLLLTTPLLEDRERSEWEADLRLLVNALLRDFHDPVRKRFIGYLHDEKGGVWGERHNDFGHTAKAYWMVYLAGQLLHEDDWQNIARDGLRDVLAAALIKRNIADAPDWQIATMRRTANADGDYFVWANEPDGNGIPTWEWCELDQSAATLALTERGFSAYLAKTYPTFFATIVDAETGGTYAYPGWTGSPKAHHWQNGYHVAEHALVGYITSALLKDQSFRLFFALPSGADEAIVPAYYFGELPATRRHTGQRHAAENPITEVEYSK